MSWKISRISNSLIGRWRESEQPANAEVMLEDIRKEMLACMAQSLNGQSQRPAAWSKVIQARDIQALWHLRSEVMFMLSQHCGETLARHSIERITPLFRGHIPPAVYASASKRS